MSRFRPLTRLIRTRSLNMFSSDWAEGMCRQSLLLALQRQGDLTGSHALRFVIRVKKAKKERYWAEAYGHFAGCHRLARLPQCLEFQHFPGTVPCGPQKSIRR